MHLRTQYVSQQSLLVALQAERHPVVLGIPVRQRHVVQMKGKSVEDLTSIPSHGHRIGPGIEREKYHTSNHKG